MSDLWERPKDIPFPSVWWTFKAKDIESDDLIEYRVQDLPEEYYDEAIKLMDEHFINDETLCNTIELKADEVSRQEVLDLWKVILKQKVALACFRENSNELVGVNMTLVTLRDEKDDYEETIKGEKWKIVYDAVKTVTKSCDIFEKFKVDKYLGAMGLCVNRNYRGRGIATEILRARVPLCKAIGMQVTSTFFSGSASQRTAEKSGFIEDLSVLYKNLTCHGYNFGKAKSKACSIMSLKIE